ncbi:VOC family protein [Metabacillus sediminilitoris]|uniref:VOC family protein n=1 Tax=Metabacillus sediminilitoris TaxID=2567941 RepID=A0A4S4BQC7_9BACI|nr:VOC family protein [Metabacillus sediminilitoris]QGQ48412.1 glyoxalase [Metabacillus sediminilitoris]THF76309.1 VOC family protein [Metabacillus sediminilitoris]
MNRKIGHVTILVNDYDEAIDFYINTLGFILLTDNSFGEGMRWVTVAPSKNHETAIVFVEADSEAKRERVGSQAAGHVFLVIETDDFIRDYSSMKEKGVTFLGEPKEMPWGVEIVFEDLYGNRFDLLQVKN